MIKTGLVRTTVTLAVMLSAMSSLSAQGIKFRIGTLPTYDFAASEVAIAKGFYKEEGLAIETMPAAGAAGISALVAGQLQVVSTSSVPILIAAMQGLNPVIIGAGDTTGDTPPDLAGLVAKKGAGFKTGKDLEGKTIAVNARNNIIWLYAREWIERTGGDPAKVTFSEVPFPQMADAVQNGRVDTAMMVEPFLSAALKAGIIESVSWPYAEVQKRIPVAQYVTTKAYADANPDAVARFRKAHDRGVDWTNQNIETQEFRQIVSAYTKVPVDRIADAARPVFVKKIKMTSLEQLAALMKKHGLLKSDIDLKAVVHPSIQE